MGFFDFFKSNIADNTSTDSTAKVADIVADVQAVIPDTKAPALIPPVKNPVLRYHTQKALGRGYFQSAEYDLAEIGRIEDTDSYCRQAFGKKVALMFKEGYDFVGKNPRTVKYVKARLAQIARASDISTDELMRSIGSGLIRKSNNFLLKVRKTTASGGKVRSEFGKTKPIEPVAAYFTIPAETMEFQFSGNKIVKWRQLMPNGDYKEYPLRDIVHFTYDRKEGFVMGTPTLVPVVDDIRALRKIEENVELLIYQHIFPLFHYKIGTPDMPAGLTEAGEREIDVARREIQYMPTEGGIVTPERHDITAIGAEGRALRAESYLEHFKKRVLSGLGVSSVDMGEPDTSNKATADNMSRNLIDGVKDYQKVIETLFEHLIINELLLESTFGDDVLNEENRVFLKFKEIDIDAQIKKQAHYTDQFNKDTITHDEARRFMGFEPIEMPDPEESRAGTVDLSQYPEWMKTRWVMFDRPKLLIQALDEPYSPVSQAVATDNSIDTSEKDLDESNRNRENSEVKIKKAGAASKAAGNVAKRKSTVRKDGFVADTFTQIKTTTVERISFENSNDIEWINSLIRTQMQTTIDQLLGMQLTAFRDGYSKVGNIGDLNFIGKMNTARSLLHDRAEHFILKLTENVIQNLRKHLNDQMTPQEIKTKTRAIFDALEYRAYFIEDVEIKKAESLGLALGLRDSGFLELFCKISDNACNTCKALSEQPIELSTLIIDSLPPHHAHCDCSLLTTKSSVQRIQDYINIIDNDENNNIEVEDEIETSTTCRSKGKK